MNEPHESNTTEYFRKHAYFWWIVFKIWCIVYSVKTGLVLFYIAFFSHQAQWVSSFIWTWLLPQWKTEHSTLFYINVVIFD